MSNSKSTSFECPDCAARYEVVRVEATQGPAIDREITCVNCGGLLQGREGPFFIKYFLIERDADDDERTGSTGLFNTAEAFRLSAIALQGERVKSRHADHPVRLIYYVALELYLKALLRQKHGVKALTTKFRHSHKLLLREAETLGLALTKEDRDIFTVIRSTDALIEARHINTGLKTWPTLEVLNHTCDSIRESIGSILSKKGVMVRL